MYTPSAVLSAGSQPSIREQGRLDLDGEPLFRDPAFMENRELPIHRWVPWIAGFSAGFVEDCFTAFLPGPGKHRILDPFAGVGTTIVSALRAGHDAIGFEINPYAALATKAKVEAMQLDIAELKDAISQYEYASKNGSRLADGTKPAGFESRIPFFSPDVEQQVHGFFSFLEKIDSESVSDLFRVAFGSVMVSFSNYTYEPSLGTRPGAGKPLIEQADVHGTILAKLRKMLADTTWLQESSRGPSNPQATIHCMNFLDAPSVVEPGMVDLSVTSPPYLNNYHYIRSTRPHLYWLGLLTARADLRKLEEENIGKYWQTVRGQAPIDLEFEDPELSVTLGQIRETRTDKGVYGGQGWANYAASYFNDSAKFLSSLAHCTAPSGYAVIVVGNSIIQGHEIKVEQVLGRIAQSHGFVLDRIELLRTKRVGASITKSTVRRGETSQASLYESAVILRRAGR